MKGIYGSEGLSNFILSEVFGITRPIFDNLTLRDVGPKIIQHY